MHLHSWGESVLDPLIISFPAPPTARQRPTAFAGSWVCPSAFADPLGTPNGRAVDQTALTSRATTQARASDEAAVTSISAGTGRAAG